MAQFDVHRLRDGALVVDCQSDLITYFETRVVVPLIAIEPDARLFPRLQPTFEIAGARRVLAIQYIGAIRSADLGPPIGSLTAQEYEIKAALDMLISGF